MKPLLSPSAIVRDALGIDPIPGFAGPACQCRACGVDIAPDAPRTLWRPSMSTFTDWQYLAAPGGSVCTDCAALTGDAGLEWTQAGVFSAEGAYVLTVAKHWVWFLENPPRSPFVVVCSDSKKQHLVWRARVSLSPDLIYLQFGRSTLRIDRPLLFAAIDAARSLAAAAVEAGLTVHHHPFQRLDFKISDRHGSLRGDVVHLAQSDPQLRAMVALLESLGEGELWAIHRFLREKPVEPEKPMTVAEARVDRAKKKQEKEKAEQSKAVNPEHPY